MIPEAVKMAASIRRRPFFGTVVIAVFHFLEIGNDISDG
jgi:hypothetical protein